MSQENVDLTSRAFQAFDDRDLDALLAVLDEDVEAFPILAGLDGGYSGHDGVRRWWAGLLGTFPDFRTEIVELRDLGDSTIAVLHMRGHAAGSDTPVDARTWQVSDFRQGKCIGWRVYTSEREALEAVGLSEKAMSQENVEVVRQALQAFADGGVDAMAEFWDPDIVWLAAQGAIDDIGEIHGPVAVRRYIQDWIDTFDDSSVVVEELRDVGDDRVLAIQRVKGRAKLSDIEIDIRYAAVSTVRDGKIVRGREYLSVDEALEAVGLSE